MNNIIARIEADIEAEADVRAFAQQYPTPNTLAALAYCESGRLSWGAVAALFARSLSAGIEAVAS